MRARSEVLLAAGVFGGLVLLAVAAGQATRGNVSADRRTSSFVYGPAGTRAFADVVERVGGRVRRWKRRPSTLPNDAIHGATVALIQPARGVSVTDAFALLNLTARGANLLIAGEGTQLLMGCLGYDLNYSILDSARVLGPSGTARLGVVTTLEPLPATRRTVSTGFAGQVPCPAIPVARADTLLRTVSGEAVVLRLHRADSPAVFMLVSDASLLGNQSLRTAELPEFILATVLALGGDVVFDEYHHLGAEGSLWRGALELSVESPWGWLIWQLLIVGFLFFLSGAPRFGPVRRSIPRERRSPLEHVRALATAMAAAKGHDVAIASLARGLHRRLGAASGGRAPRLPRGEWGAWLAGLSERIPDPVARARAQSLGRFARAGQPDDAVREMANSLEDVWEALHR